MKIGCCTNMVATLKDGTGVEHVEMLKEVGYDYIELPLAQMVELSDEEFTIFEERIRSSGIKCEVCNNFFPAHIRLTGNEVNKEVISNYIEVALGRACQLGVSVIVFGSSGAKNVPQGFSKDKAWEQIVELLQYVDSQVKQQGITIAIEPLNRLESNIVNTAAEGLKLVKEVDRENIKLLVDYYHLTMENENQAIVLEAGHQLGHVHFACPISRVYPNESDDLVVEYSIFINNLKKIGYEGRISIEAFTQDLRNDAIKALALMKKQVNTGSQEKVRV
jgi:D-psicose/D-tagatose/L-ribulose 3-epimerase